MEPTGGKVKSRWTRTFFTALNRRNDDERYICDICHKDLATPASLSLHRNTHVIERPFKCEPCQVSFNTQGHLHKHRRSTAHENRVAMTQTFGSPSSDNPRPYGCPRCDIAFRKHGHLAKHLRSKSHITRLETNGLVPVGTYAALERSGPETKDQLITTNCEHSLQSLRSIVTSKLNMSLDGCAEVVPPPPQPQPPPTSSAQHQSSHQAVAAAPPSMPPMLPPPPPQQQQQQQYQQHLQHLSAQNYHAIQHRLDNNNHAQHSHHLQQQQQQHPQHHSQPHQLHHHHHHQTPHIHQAHHPALHHQHALAAALPLPLAALPTTTTSNVHHSPMLGHVVPLTTPPQPPQQQQQQQHHLQAMSMESRTQHLMNGNGQHLAAGGDQPMMDQSGVGVAVASTEASTQMRLQQHLDPTCAPMKHSALTTTTATTTAAAAAATTPTAAATTTTTTTPPVCFSDSVTTCSTAPVTIQRTGAGASSHLAADYGQCRAPPHQMATAAAAAHHYLPAPAQVAHHSSAQISAAAAAALATQTISSGPSLIRSTYGSSVQDRQHSGALVHLTQHTSGQQAAAAAAAAAATTSNAHLHSHLQQPVHAPPQ